jgi:hypothetical protein
VGDTHNRSENAGDRIRGDIDSRGDSVSDFPLGEDAMKNEGGTSSFPLFPESFACRSRRYGVYNGMSKWMYKRFKAAKSLGNKGKI